MLNLIFHILVIHLVFIGFLSVLIIQRTIFFFSIGNFRWIAGPFFPLTSRESLLLLIFFRSCAFSQFYFFTIRTTNIIN